MSELRTLARFPRHSSWLLVSLAAATALTACHRSQSGDYPPPEVSVSVIEPKAIRLTDEFNGRVESVDAVELRPRVSGYIEKVIAREGDYVPSGTILFIIDQRPYRIALERANAQLERARAAWSLSKLQLKRSETLVAARATSQEELDNASAANAQAEAEAKAAEAAVDEAKLNLGFTEVRAPISGRVGRALLTVGNLAQADQSLLTTVVSQDPIYVYFDCDEQSYLRYNARRTDPRSLPITGDLLRVGLANEQGFPHSGTIDFLNNRLDPATGTIRARVRIQNPDHVFISGLYARVQLSSPRSEPALLVDDKAVLTDQDKKYVYVVGPENRALRRDVSTGRVIDGFRLIEGGLKPGDKVVVEGLQKIFYPGAPVKPVLLGAQATTSSAGQAQ